MIALSVGKDRSLVSTEACRDIRTWMWPWNSFFLQAKGGAWWTRKRMGMYARAYNLEDLENVCREFGWPTSRVETSSFETASDSGTEAPSSSFWIFCFQREWSIWSKVCLSIITDRILSRTDSKFLLWMTELMCVGCHCRLVRPRNLYQRGYKLAIGLVGWVAQTLKFGTGA